MAKILTPKETTSSSTSEQKQDVLLKGNYLSEFSGAEDIIRNNLDVLSAEEVSEKIKSESTDISQDIVDAEMNEHLLAEDPHETIPKVNQILKSYVNKNGSTPFDSEQKYSDNVAITDEKSIVPAKYVRDAITNHNGNKNAHNISAAIADALAGYVKSKDVLDKKDQYSKKQIDDALKTFVRRDGSTPFTEKQKGVMPSGHNDVVIKGYVDNLIKDYISIDKFDDFKKAVDKLVKAKANASDVFKKDSTLNKIAIERLVNKTVTGAVDDAIEEHQSSEPHLTLKDIETYLGLSGGGGGSNPDGFIDLLASPGGMTTFGGISTFGSPDPCCYYTPHGPTESIDVGFVTTGTDLSDPISYQNLFDMILYESKVSVKATPEYIEMGVCSPICVEMEVVGGNAVDYVELYFNNTLVGTYDFATDFTLGKKTVCNPDIPLVCEDTEVLMRVYYANSTTKDATDNVYAVAAAYVGLLPKWLFGTNLTYPILQQLVEGSLIDPFVPIYGMNTVKLIGPITAGLELTINYNFPYDGVARHPFVFYPKDSVGQLYEMDSTTQQFSTFSELTDIPIVLPDGTTKVYTSFIYNPAVTSWDTDITWKFS